MADNLLKVYSVLSVPGKREFYPHHHSELEIAWFRSGRGTYSVTGMEYPIEAGDIFMFANNEIHKITWVDPAIPMEALNVHFHPRLILTEDPALGLPRLFFDRRAGFSHRLRAAACRDAGHFAEICRALADLERELSEDQPGSELLARHALTRALVYILRGFDLTADTDRFSHSGAGAVAAALEYIDGHFRDDLTLSDLCAQLSMSRSNFERLFTRFAGISFGEYIKRRRIDYAAELLLGTGMTVLEAAMASGYHNTANFNKQFKAVTGMAPGEYRSVGKA